MANKFKVGDSVELKSGGPPMTVTGVLQDGDRYHCKWFGGKRLEDGQFPEDALQRPKTRRAARPRSVSG